MIDIGKCELALVDLERSNHLKNQEKDEFFMQRKAKALLGLNRYDEAMEIYKKPWPNNQLYKKASEAVIQEFEEYEEKYNLKMSDWYKGQILCRTH